MKKVLDVLPPEDERAKFAHNRIAAIEPTVPRIDIHLATGAPPETSIERDGQGATEVRKLPRPLLVDTGDHVFVVTAPGRAPRRFTIVIGPSESKSLAVEPGEVVVAGAPPPTPPPVPPAPPPAPITQVTPAPDIAPDAWTPMAKAGVGLLITGGAFVAVGIGTGVMAIGDKSTVGASCSGPRCTTQAGVDAAKQGRVVSTISTVGVIAGGVGLATGVALVVVGRQRPKVVVVPTTGGAACVGVF
jgi:hypothetical protein